MSDIKSYIYIDRNCDAWIEKKKVLLIIKIMCILSIYATFTHMRHSDVAACFPLHEEYVNKCKFLPKAVYFAIRTVGIEFIEHEMDSMLWVANNNKKLLIGLLAAEMLKLNFIFL